tara:strand:- start:614 stop:1237 length:624 start_codon:yes stop_codon:yes gene_type:complete
MTKGLFVSIEGIEGAGKSTLIEHLKKHAQFQSDTLFTREPGGTPIAEAIRKILVSREHSDMEAMTELLLVYASRQEHIRKVIEPELSAGKIVISDRFYDASYAYQAGGRHLDVDILAKLDDWVVQKTTPRLTILIKAPIQLCLDRVYSRGNQDRFDDESSPFFMAVQSMYTQRADRDPDRFLIVDGTQSPDEILDICVSKILSLRKL